ncbi:MAG: hypothetical protein VW258_15430, partial [Thalassolituus sp.]
MLQTSLTLSISVIILIASVVALVLLLRQRWFRQWLRGTAGMLLLAGSVWLGFVVWDLASYRSVMMERPLATVSIYEIGPQEYDLTLVDSEGNEERFVVRGDQWQLDVRMLVWKGPLRVLGQEPLYRFDRLSGRYLSLEQERNDERTVYGFGEPAGFDVWEWLRDYDLWLDADFGSAVYMPMDNGAVFSVVRTSKGLVARPVNDVAEEAVAGQW